MTVTGHLSGPYTQVVARVYDDDIEVDSDLAAFGIDAVLDLVERLTAEHEVAVWKVALGPVGNMAVSPALASRGIRSEMMF